MKGLKGRPPQQPAWHSSSRTSIVACARQRHQDHQQDQQQQQQPATSATRLADLPALAMAAVTAALDPASRRALALTSRGAAAAVAASWHALSLPLDALRRTDIAGLAAAHAGAACLELLPPTGRVSLSVLGHRRRCEQLLAVSLDNAAAAAAAAGPAAGAQTSLDAAAAGAWPGLSALDVSAALPHIGAETLALLAGALPQLAHLALPAVAAPGGAAEVLSILQPGLASLALHCGLFPQQQAQQQAPGGRGGSGADGGGGGIARYQHDASKALALHQLAAARNADAAVPYAQLAHMRLHDTVTAAGADEQQHADGTSASGSGGSQLPANAWAQLCSMQALQALQLTQPSGLAGLLQALAGCTGLRSLSLAGVCRTVAGQLLDPGVSSGAGLSGSTAGDGCTQRSTGLQLLAHLPLLMRLEISLDTACSGQPRLITPPHVLCSSSSRPGGSGSTSAAGACHGGSGSSSSYICCWSHLSHLQELLLGGLCLDLPALAATAACSSLTALTVCGLQLDVQAAASAGGLSGCPVVLQRLRVLHVTRRFCMGPHAARVVFPELQRLAVRDTSSSCPDLSCLQHHPSLRCLAVEAPGGGWQLAQLQMGHLLHAPQLHQLSLSSSGVHAACSSSRWLPQCCLPQVTCLSLAGPASDTTASNLGCQFPRLRTLQLRGSELLSDGGLKKLARVPCLAGLLLERCRHVTEFGVGTLLRSGGLRALAVHGCAGVDARAAERIRRTCRGSSATLHWGSSDVFPHGVAAIAGSWSCGASGLPDAAAAGGSSSSGAAFLERCWRESASNRSSANGSASSQAADGWGTFWKGLLPPCSKDTDVDDAASSGSWQAVECGSRPSGRRSSSSGSSCLIGHAGDSSSAWVSQSSHHCGGPVTAAH